MKMAVEEIFETTRTENLIPPIVEEDNGSEYSDDSSTYEEENGSRISALCKKFCYFLSILLMLVLDALLGFPIITSWPVRIFAGYIILPIVVLAATMLVAFWNVIFTICQFFQSTK